MRPAPFFIAAAFVALAPAAALAALPAQLLVIGTELMDLYTGTLTPAEIGSLVLEQLQADQLLAWEAYRPWV